MTYDFKEIEKKWAPKYEGVNFYKGKDFGGKEKKYVLVEFPYPSGEGLHVGHAFSMTGADVYARFMRMKGYNVMFPMGWDAFGLPTENYAIKTGIQPQITTDRVTKLFKQQMKRLAFSFDWDREVNTTLPDYYKWTQWIFIKLFERGLAEKQSMPINWCPKDKIGLANEEVIDGKCERCGTQTEKRTISQWVVKITDYADRLISGLENTDFIEKVKAAQINWIGKKEGAKIRFEIKETAEKIEVFTTRPDTLPGVTFMVLAPEHPLVKTLSAGEVKTYLDRTKGATEKERTDLNREKTGVFFGMYAINPLTKKEIPIWISDYVLMGYGTGAIMAVPSHDERDGHFAEKFNLPIDKEFVPDMTAIDKVVEMGVGEKAVTYHLRDWIFSRQHYWGEPIPMVFCESCARNEIATAQSTEIRNDGRNAGWQPVPLEQLPVVLPPVEKYQPTDTGESPLANIREWVETTCPKCGGKAKRETDTMPNWAGSDWYFLRYCDNNNDKELADMGKLRYWLPVDVYVGGDEHNTLHLLYSRFIYMLLYDLGVVPKEHPEPYKKRLSHGVILAPDGKRMSKSKGNVITPDAVADIYGTDVVRSYMMFMGPFDATMAWNERSLVGVKRFIEKMYKLVAEKAHKDSVSGNESKRLINGLVKKSGEDLGEFKFNTVIAKLMETVNGLTGPEVKVADEELKMLVKVVSPFAPYLAEELWLVLGGKFSVHGQMWPEYSESYLTSETITLPIQINGKLRGTIEVALDESEEKIVERVKGLEKITAYLNSGELKKIIFVKGRMINFVIG